MCRQPIVQAGPLGGSCCDLCPDEIALNRTEPGSESCIMVFNVPTQVQTRPTRIAYLDAAGRVLRTNAAWQEYLRTYPEAFDAVPVGGSYLGACERPGDDAGVRQAILAGLRNVLAGEAEFHLNYARADDTSRRMHFWAGRDLGLGQDFVMIQHKDVTVSHLMAIADNVETAGGRLISDHLTDVIFRFRLKPDLGFEYISPGVLNLTGYSAEDYYANPHLSRQIVHPDDVHLLDSARVPTPDCPTQRITTRWIRRDGTTVWTEQHNRVIFDETGAAFAVEGIARDVTEQKRVESQLIESQQRYEQVLQSLAEGLVLQDADLKILSINPSAERILGYSVDELNAAGPDRTGFWDLVDEQGVAVPVERIPGVRALRTGEAVDSTILGLRNRDGDRIWISLSARPIIRPGETAPFAIVSSVVDITQRLEADRQRERLAQSEKLRAIGQMASGVAHDLNQYLGMVAGHSELALQYLGQMPQPDTRLHAALSAIVGAAMDGAETVRRLLTFSRTNPEGDAVSVDLCQLVREVVKLTAPNWRDAAQAQGRPITLDVVTEDDEVRINGWPASLREALTNLVFNAVDALPEGGRISLKVIAGVEEAAVVVSDTGVGMAPEVQLRAFEPFFSTKGERGTGLGMSMVFGIVNRHDGRIEVESSPGNGTRIALWLPMQQAQTAAPVRPVTSKSVRSLRILAVDDEPQIIEILESMLNIDGHWVSVATTGEQALELVGVHHFDLIVSDLGLGTGMNGWELCQRVHRQWPALPFVLATGWGAQIDGEDALSRGVAAVLAKPYRLSDVRRVISTFAGVPER